MKKIIHIDDVGFITNADYHRKKDDFHPRDQGRFKQLISDETGSKDINLGIGWLEPGEIHILHHHPKASEFYYVLEGSSEITVGDEKVQARAGTVCYIPAGVSHKIVNNTRETCVVLFGYNYPTYRSVWDE